MNKALFFLVMTVLVFAPSCNFNKKQLEVASINYKQQWVDSVYNSLSLNEKVGQLFMVAAYSNRDSVHINAMQKLIKNYKIGGIIFFQGGPVRQAQQTNLYQKISKTPLLIGVDGEWGLNMRLDSTARYPYNMTLGAIQNNTIITSIGGQIAKDCKRLGVHINFAPVVDINTNPKNPVIGVRSFGEDKTNVAKKAIAYTKGIQNEGVLACAKHFPGHGDTDTDSHKTLPTVSFSKTRIDSVELYPYKQLFHSGISGVMVAHLNVPSLEPQKGLPSSLSHTIVTNILKEKMNYKGLVFTDALNMKGVANYKEPGVVDLMAFKAGSDVLLFTENAPKAISKIMEAYKANEISEKRLAHSVKKILSAKYSVGLYAFKPIKISGLVQDLNKSINDKLYQEAIKNALTVLKNDTAFIPLQKKANQKLAYLELGDASANSFFNTLQEYANITDLTNLPEKDLLNTLKKYDKVIIAYTRKNGRLTHKMSDTNKALIERISKAYPVLLNVFASQYCLQDVSLKNTKSVIVSYENTVMANKISARIIYGDLQVKGKLPASISKDYPVYYGIES